MYVRAPPDDWIELIVRPFINVPLEQPGEGVGEPSDAAGGTDAAPACIADAPAIIEGGVVGPALVAGMTFVPAAPVDIAGMSWLALVSCGTLDSVGESLTGDATVLAVLGGSLAIEVASIGFTLPHAAVVSPTASMTHA